jgi:hypothetical protein
MPPKPSWFDWITVVAIIVGPVFALFAQRVLDWLREKKQRRVQLYLTAMSMRATWLHSDSLRALNSIDTVFGDRHDKPIRDAWSAVLQHANTKRPDWNTERDGAQVWDARLLDLRVDLYQLLGNAVGFNHTVDYIKTQFYYPQYHVDMEMEQMQIRKQFAKAITDDGLKVIVKSS